MSKLYAALSVISFLSILMTASDNESPVLMVLLMMAVEALAGIIFFALSIIKEPGRVRNAISEEDDDQQIIEDVFVDTSWYDCAKIGGYKND